MNQRVVKAKENVITIQQLINQWNEIPLFERIKKDGRNEDLLNIEGKKFGKYEGFEKLRNRNRLISDNTIIFIILYFIVSIVFLILGMGEKKQARYADVKKVGTEILTLVGDCQKLFQASEDSVHWHAYLEFIEQIVVTG